MRLALRGPFAALVLTAAAVLLSGLGPAPASAHDVHRSAKPRCTAGHRAPESRARVSRAGDDQHYTLGQLRSIDRRLQRRLAARALAGPGAFARLGLPLRIPVHVHVIDGARSQGPSLLQVHRQLAVLNNAYSGGQSPNNTPTRFRFYLASLDRVHNQRWHTASITNPADGQLRRALHIGGPDALNLYFSAPVDPVGGSVILGWSSMPWKAAAHPLLDGVTINDGSLPGGRLRNYNLGDTTVHEVGHWLGLFHTFEGGCSPLNDRVADTPAEASPSMGCPAGRDTCTAPGLDPIHNFMDYSFDSCMNMFTPGQVSRMTDNWLAYRTP